MKTTRFLIIALTLVLGFSAQAQTNPGAVPPANPPAAAPETKPLTEAELRMIADQKRKERQAFDSAERDGIKTRLDSIAHFRGTWSQQLMGIGLVTGLSGTGDSAKNSATQKALINMLRRMGMDLDPAAMTAKNCALVTVTATLPPYSAPGQNIDITVSTMGDASSLRNGTLIGTPLKYPGAEDVYALASGPISVGGFTATGGGNSSARGFVTVGRIPGGGTIQQSVPTTTVFSGKMYIDLDQADIVTAHRIESAINSMVPEYGAVALGGGTIQVTLPNGENSTTAQSKLMSLIVSANTEAKVVIDERTGTVVIGGNVRVAPCAIASGSLSVKVEEQIGVSQPAPLSQGTTAVVSQKSVSADEETAQIAVVRPNTTVADLVGIFQSLKMRANEIIAILQSMHTQGALKARVVIQ